MERLSEYLTWWLTEVARPRVRPGTYRHYEWLVRVHIVPGIGTRPLTAVTPLEVESWLAGLRRAGLSGQSAAHARACLRRAYNDAVRYGYASSNPAAQALPPRREAFVVVPLTVDEAKTLLRSVAGTRHEALYAVALALGLRQGELCALRWADIDLDAGVVTLRWQLQWVDGEPCFERPKGQKMARRIHLPATVAQRLREHRIRQAQERLRCGRWQDFDLVFARRDGAPYRGSSLYHAFRKHLEAAGLPRKRFHDLRHSAASILFSLGTPIEVISQVLGHSDVSFTAGTYMHLFEEAGRAAAERWDAMEAEE